jgi:hypothetical protein
MDWTAEVRFPAGVRDFSLLHSVQSSSGAHRANTMGTKGKAAGGMKIPSHLHLVKNGGAVPLLPNTSARCVESNKHRDNFTFFMTNFQ